MIKPLNLSNPFKNPNKKSYYRTKQINTLIKVLQHRIKLHKDYVSELQEKSFGVHSRTIEYYQEIIKILQELREFRKELTPDKLLENPYQAVAVNNLLEQLANNLATFTAKFPSRDQNLYIQDLNLSVSTYVEHSIAQRLERLKNSGVNIDKKPEMTLDNQVLEQRIENQQNESKKFLEIMSELKSLLPPDLQKHIILQVGPKFSVIKNHKTCNERESAVIDLGRKIQDGFKDINEGMTADEALQSLFGPIKKIIAESIKQQRFNLFGSQTGKNLTDFVNTHLLKEVAPQVKHTHSIKS